MGDRRLAIEVWESLFRAQHELFTKMALDFDNSELSQAEYDVLLSVTRGTDHRARLRDVTAQMLISQPSVSRLIDRMVGRGLITKDPDPDDGRGYIITATPEALRVFRDVAVAHGRSIAAHMSILDDTELRTLAQLTEKLRGN